MRPAYDKPVIFAPRAENSVRPSHRPMAPLLVNPLSQGAQRSTSPAQYRVSSVSLAGRIASAPRVVASSGIRHAPNQGILNDRFKQSAPTHSHHQQHDQANNQSANRGNSNYKLSLFSKVCPQPHESSSMPRYYFRYQNLVINNLTLSLIFRRSQRSHERLQLDIVIMPNLFLRLKT